MNKKSYIDILIDKYIKNNLENSKILNYKDLDNIESCFYDELKDTEIKGFPFASDFTNSKGDSISYDVYKQLSEDEKKKYRLKYYYMPYMHEIYIGTTGSGKTTTCIEPQLRAISSQKNKPNIFISDPKGEIFSHNVKHLIDNGYKIQVLNFKDPSYSNTWNPLEEIYLTQMEIPNIGKDAKIIKGNKVDPNLLKIGQDESFNENFYISYNGKAFSSYKIYKKYVESKKYFMHSKVTSMVNQLCIQMFPEERISDDPTWNIGAREYFNGCMLALLDDAINLDKNFTKEMFNIKTLNDIYTLTVKCDSEEGLTSELIQFNNFKKGKSKEALDKIEIVSDAARGTKQGYLSTCQSLIGNWMNGHIFSLTTTTNISLDDSESPIALFVITRDYDKSDNAVAGLFLNWVYTKFLEKAEKEERINGVNGSRPLHFLLDEFANIPAIPDFEIKIATSRSRNMWFHLCVQSYEQLNGVYDKDEKEVSKIIIDNCNQQVFLGSQSYETKEKFSDECGNKTVVGINNNPLNIEKVRNLSFSDINNIKEGTFYIKRINKDVIKSSFIRSYELANEGIFKDFEEENYIKYLPYNFVNPEDMKYKYKDVIPMKFNNKESNE